MLPTKGSLVLKRPLDKEARDVIEVTVTAVDHGTPSLQATTRVQVNRFVKFICKAFSTVHQSFSSKIILQY
jgi:hypothetical protein